MAAIGSEANAAGYPTVPDVGEDGVVKWGAREINRTRDFIAQLKLLIPATRAAFRTKSGLTSGSAAPSDNDGQDGDWYAQTLN